MKKKKLEFLKVLHDPKLQKISRRVRNKTGRLKEEDFTKRFTI